MKRNIEKRFEELEKVLLPKPKGKPMLVFWRHVPSEMSMKELKASMKDYDAANNTPVMIMSRPGDPVRKTAAQENAEYEKHKKSGNADPALVVTIVHTPKGKGGPAAADVARPDPEPDDAALEAEIEELEARKAALKGKP